MRRTSRTALALAVVLIGLGACGDDDTSDEFAGGSSSSTSAAGGSSSEDETGSDATTSSTGGASDATTSSTGGGAEEEPAFTEEEADAVLEYELVDYAFEGPLEAEAGKLFFKAVNTGTEDHELEVLDGDGEALGEIVAMPPDAEGELALELEPGTYRFQCILENADGTPHTELGMEDEFVVE